jgi:hypothetical protein
LEAAITRQRASMFVGASDPAEAPFLEGSQQLRLQIERQFADLVEHERSLARELEKPPLAGTSVRKSTSLMAEELGCQKVGGDRRAIHRDKRLLSFRTRVVNAPGEETLACTGLPHDEYGGAPSGGHAHGELDRLEDGGAPSDDGLEADLGRAPTRRHDVSLDFSTSELVAHGSTP